MNHQVTMQPISSFAPMLLTIGACCVAASASLGAEKSKLDYSAVIPRLEQAVRAQMDLHHIQGIAVALVDDQQTVYATGFGTAKKDSIFRCGSISKLFNAVAVMQLVEAGQLDLDAPVQRYVPTFSIVNPFPGAPPITLRELLCHRSGMVREAPVGGYMDVSAPSLADTIASLQSCVLVNPPNTKTRYSNVGASLAGLAVSTVAGLDYDAYQQANVLGPIGMTSSSYRLKGVPRGRVMDSYMRVTDGHGGFVNRQTPLFELGTIPAGNLFTTAEDLARFLSMLAANGRAGERQIVSAASFAQMFTPQLVNTDTGFGMGFFAGKFRAHKTIQHLGAVFGFTSMVLFLPESKLGVVVLANEDIVTGPVRKLTLEAMSLLLETKLGEKPPAELAPFTVSANELAAFTGDYESESFWAHLEVADGELRANVSGQPVRLVAVGTTNFVANGRLEDDTPVSFERDSDGRIRSFTMGQKFTRVAAHVAEVPEAWKAFCGSYGNSIIPVVISVRHGHLYAMTENMVDYRLTPVNRNVFALPEGMYADEELVFLTNVRGKPLAINFANMILKRR